MRKAAWTLLLSFVFAIPWEYSLDLGAPFGNIARIIGLVLLPVALLAVLRAGRIRSIGLLQWLTFALYLWFCCSLLWTSVPDVTMVKLRGYPQEMMLVWLLWEFGESPEDFRNLLRAWLAGSWVLAILTVGNFVSPNVAVTEQIRFVPIGQDPNDVARFLDLGFPIAALLQDGRGKWFSRVLALGYFPLGLTGVLLTASRGGFLGATVALAGCAVLVLRRYPKGLLGGVFALPSLAGIIWMIVPSETLERLGTISEQLRNGDLNQRVNIWSAGWHAFLQAPLCGHGAGSFATAAGLAPIDTAHNTVLAVLVEGGLCGLALATTIVVASVHSIGTIGGALRVGLSTLMAVWLLSSLVGTVGENRTTWLLLGMIALIQRLAEEQSDAVEEAFSLATRTLEAAEQPE